MRMTQHFSRTQRNIPSEAQVISHQLLLRAGFIRQLAAGIFSYLPLAHRALTKLENIVRDEMNAIGGQEITMPVVNPAEIWQETGRWYTIGSEMGRFKDKADRDMVLAMTHEEVVVNLARNEIKTYRQLPQLIYHIQTKWRDDPRPRAGLIRVREFTMKDSYSLDADAAGLDKQYRAHYQAYFNIYRRCGLDPIAVGADTGMMGGSMSHEYMVLTPIGEDTLRLCDSCGYAANRQIARFQKPVAEQETPAAIQKVATPAITTIQDLTTFLNVPQRKTAKAVFMMAEIMGEATAPATETFVFAVIRGDMEVNETKLANAVKAKSLRPATEVEIRAIGAEPGYGSPLGVHDALIVVDDAIPTSPNLVAGANEPGYHLLNVNYERDFVAAIVSDIAAAQSGDACPHCGHTLRAARGVEVGNIFKLGTRYTEAMQAYFKAADDTRQPIVMGSYGIGIGRTLACVAEIHNDEHGLIWPITIAPYQVHLVALGGKQAQVPASAEQLYTKMQTAGIEVLYDDRKASPGVKFNDADLIGIPLRLTVGWRRLKHGQVELKRRNRPERVPIRVEDAVDTLKATIAEMKAKIMSKVSVVDFQ